MPPAPGWSRRGSIAASSRSSRPTGSPTTRKAWIASTSELILDDLRTERPRHGEGADLPDPPARPQGVDGGRQMGRRRSPCPPGCSSFSPPTPRHPRPAVGVLGVQPVPLRRHRPVVAGAAPSRRHRRGAGGAGGTVAATVRPGDDDRPQVVDRSHQEGDHRGTGDGRCRRGHPRRRHARLVGARRRRARPTGDREWAALLPGLDATVMGWKERDWYLDPGMVPKLFDTVGNAGNTVLVSGRVVGAWGQRPDGTVVVGLLDRIERRLPPAGRRRGGTAHRAGSTARWSPPGSRHRSSRS